MTMQKRTPLTEYASIAGNELFQLSFVGKEIMGDIGYDESRLKGRNKQWPDIPPITNEPFNTASSRFLGILQLCRAVDIYNWYCREALKLALSTNPNTIVGTIRKATSRIAEVIAKADKKNKDAAAEVVREFLSDRYKGDKVIREAIHRDLDVLQNPEIELICVCRNVLVHKRGYDEFGEIKQGIQDLGNERALIGAPWYPDGHMPVALDSQNYLVIDASVGNWAAELLHQQIFMMDQNFAHVYKLPRKVWDTPSIGRKFLGESKPAQAPPLSPPK